MKVRIYSNKHDAWWRPRYMGYTEDIREAGIFDYHIIIEKYPHLKDATPFDEDYLIEVIK